MTEAIAAHWSLEAEAAITTELVACTLGLRRRPELSVSLGARLARLGRDIDAAKLALGIRLLPVVTQAARAMDDLAVAFRRIEDGGQ